MAIRRSPDDFLVEERLGEAYRASLAERRSEERRHAVFRLEKTSLTTPEAIAHLGRAFRARGDAIGYAGLKDRHARTIQHVSIALPAKAEDMAFRGAGGPSWTATWLGWSDRQLAAEAIDGNRFTIVVRGLAHAEAEAMATRAARLARGGDLLVANYFGDQRFGSARHGQGFAARALVRGRFDEALKLLVGTPFRRDHGATRVLNRLAAEHWGDWKRIVDGLRPMPERRAFEVLAAGGDFREAFATLPPFTQLMCVEAYQSHLWNETVRRLVRSTLPVAAIVRTANPFGELLFPTAGTLPAGWDAMEIPLLAPKSELAEPWGPFAQGTLDAEGVALADLRIPGLRRPFFGEARRPLLARVGSFDLSPATADDATAGRIQRTARFDLPRGAYATVVLRALGQ